MPKTKPAPPTFAIGDRVEIIRFGYGEVISLRGPLGPNGEQVYRVEYTTDPDSAYIEVLGNEIRPLKSGSQPKPAA
jgi:hypothetical protein